jgi:hypothetical protein
VGFTLPGNEWAEKQAPAVAASAQIVFAESSHHFSEIEEKTRLVRQGHT